MCDVTAATASQPHFDNNRFNSHGIMGVFNVFIVSKSGGLIYHHDHNLTTQEVEKTFGYPLDIKLQTDPNRVFVMFGQRDGIAVGHSLLAVNGVPVSQNNPRLLDDGREVRTDCKHPRTTRIMGKIMVYTKCHLIRSK